MASHVMARAGLTFPVGTVVSVYENLGETRRDAPPSTSVVASGTVDSQSSVTFSGLDDGTEYWAVAQVSGVWRWVGFRTDPASIYVPGPEGEKGDTGDTGPAGSLSNVRSGVVSGAGAIIAGSGFTVNRAAPGRYVVTLNATAATQWVATATVYDTAGTSYNVKTVVQGFTTTTFTVDVATDATGAHVDAAFTFVAISS